MDFEQWWLLIIPVSFGLGWAAARVDIRQLLTESRRLPRSYFKGLNFLLSEQPDRAIDAFIEVVKLDPETTELHFALGNLFRRRGETERAIRMHRNLLARADLPDDLRSHAMYELGQDYLRAGILDRAEEAFRQLDQTQWATDARRSLLEIFQIEKEWGKAIAIGNELQESGAGSFQVLIAQFHCELAQSAVSESRFDDARTEIDQALAANRKNARALMIAGDISVIEGHDDEAIGYWKRIEQQSAPHIALVAQRMMEAFVRLGRGEEGLRMLRAFYDAAPSVDLLDIIVRATSSIDGLSAAHEAARDALHRQPSLLGLNLYLETRTQVAAPEDRVHLDVVKSLVHGHVGRIGRYTCSHCGFRARQFYWQCPGCTTWESYPPLRSEELDAGK